jgi:hypothetical protein
MSDETQEMQQATQGCLGLPLQFGRFLKLALPHVAVLPAAMIVRRGWVVSYATSTRYFISLLLAFPVVLVSPLILAEEPVTEALNKEITLSYAWALSMAVVSFGFFVTGRILRSWKPQPGFSGYVGTIRFLPEGFWWQMLPSITIVILAIINQHVWKQYRPFGAVCAYYAVLLAWDQAKALHSVRRLRIGANDARKLSDVVMPPPVPHQNDNPPTGGEGRTGELVRIYGRSSRK